AMQYNHITDTQSMLGMQDGAIVWSAPANVTMRLEDDPQFVQWASQLTPESVYLTSLETDVTRYRAAIVPVQLAEDETPAVFLTAFDVEAELHELRMSLFIFTGAGAGAMLIGGVVAWLLLGRMLQPVRDLQENAQ